MTRTLVAALAVMLLLAPVLPFAAVGGAAAAPAGMSTIPDANVADDVPAGETIPLSASELEGGVMASQHADSLSVTLTTAAHAPAVMDSDGAVVSGDGMALVLRDGQQSAGREVAIDAGQLQEALGYRPEAIHGTHEDGSEWTASAEYVDGYLVFDVPHFSSNTVTFSGEVSIDASGATNDTQFEYAVADGANVSDASLELTGILNTETENRSWNDVSDTVIDPGVGGNVDPTNSKITVSMAGGGATDTGKQTGKRVGVGDVDGDGTDEIGFPTPNDNIKIYDPDDGSTSDTGVNSGYGPAMGDSNGDGSAELGVRSSEELVVYDPSDGSTSNTGQSAWGVYVAGDSDGDGVDEFAIREGSSNDLLVYDMEDGSATDVGDQIGDPMTVGDTDGDSYEEFGYVDSDGTVTTYDETDGRTTYAAEESRRPAFADTDGDGRDELSVENGSNGLLLFDPIDDTEEDLGVSTYGNYEGGDIDNDGIGEVIFDTQSAVGVYDPSDDSTRKAIDYRGDPRLGDTDGDGHPEVVSQSLDEDLLIYDETISANGSIDVGDDGTTDFTFDLSTGESITKDVPSLSVGDSIDLTSGNAVSTTVSFTERTVTKDPEVGLTTGDGSQTIDHLGTVTDGETIDLSAEIDESRIGGSTTVTITVDDPASGPPAKIDLNYSHSAQDQISTSYQATTFEESYNISHTYADATENAQVTIPFASSRVVGVKTVEYRLDAGSWASVSPDNYRLDGTTLDVYLDDATGGVDAGQTVDVRATGRKIAVDNGAVTVTDPTAPGEELDTQLQIDSRSPGFAVNVGPTDDGDRVHYAYADGFPTEDYVVIEANGDQQLYLPNAVTSDQFRVSHLDTRVVAEQGDVRIDVIEAGEDPELDVSPGPGGAGDPVTVEYYNTETGVTYLLNSLTRSIVVDSDTAQSPAIFEDDDSEDTWAILRDSGPTGSSGGGGAVGQFRETASGAVGAISLPINGSGLGQLALVGVLGLGGVVVFRRLWPFGSDDSDAVTRDTSTASGSSSGRLSGLATQASGLVGSLGSVGGRAARGAGSGLLTALQRVLDYFGRVTAIILGNRRASIAAAVIAAIVAARVGLVQLPEGTGILIVVSGVPLATWLIMRRSDAVSRRVWLASTIAAVILGLEFVAPGTVQTAIEQLTSEQVAPLLILVGAGGLYLWYRARQSDRPQIIIGGNDE